jgi:hypothetical protein
MKKPVLITVIALVVGILAMTGDSLTLSQLFMILATAVGTVACIILFPRIDRYMKNVAKNRKAKA